jgi:protein-S-isoprenylcysteine O-methyltransferase Ste14
MQSKHGGANVKVAPPLVFVGMLLVGVLLGFLFPVGEDLNRVLWRTVGAVFVGAGVFLIAWAVSFFRRTQQRPEPWLPTPSMIFEGPYRFTRNPMYVGMTFMQIGIGFALMNLWVSALAFVALALVHRIAVLPEESYLTEKFGRSYTQFTQRVRRYL